MSKHNCPRTTVAGISALILSAAYLSGAAQVNSWVNPQGGAWESSSWSLGTPPGTGQIVLITNAGYRTVTVSASTVQNFPSSLSVGAIHLGASAGSGNTLLLDSPGLTGPLAADALRIGTNAAVVLCSAALSVGGPNESTFSVGGAFNQGGFSEVTANQMDIGWLGPGIYSMTNGVTRAEHLYLGGPFGGRFEQQGGSVWIGILHLESGGEYALRGGDYQGTNYFDRGVFRQEGGSFNSDVKVAGTYVLTGGVFRGAMGVPDYYDSGYVIQTGGSNLAPVLRLGDYNDHGSGHYTLSNGVVATPFTDIRYFGNFYQYGGTHAVDGPLRVVGMLVHRGSVGRATYRLDAGLLSAHSLEVTLASYLQTGGTNRIGSDLVVGSSYESFFDLYGGRLESSNTVVLHSSSGGFLQTGGVHVVRERLTVQGPMSPFFRGYTLAGGELTVPNILVRLGAAFRLQGGTLRHSGVFTLEDGILDPGPGTHNLGPLQLLSSGGFYPTNSMLWLPASPCIVRFAPSGGIAWEGDAVLIIRNWSGSVGGSGAHQVLFGDSRAGLTPQQVGCLQFLDPVGFTPGVYAANLLASGEIVPDALPLVGREPPILELVGRSDGTAQLWLRGEAGGSYAVERSADLNAWSFWTNLHAVNGLASAVDSHGTNQTRGFYRAYLLP